MKKLLFGLLLLSSTIYSQFDGRSVYFNAGFDARNLISGSDPTQGKSELDLLLKAGLVFDGGYEFSLNYECFNRIGFYMGSIGIGKQISLFNGNNIYKTSKWMIVPTIYLGQITRNWEKVDGKDPQYQIILDENNEPKFATDSDGNLIQQGYLPPLKSTHLTMGVSIPLRYYFNDNFNMELDANLTYRPDDEWRYNDGGKWCPNGSIRFQYNLPID